MTFDECYKAMIAQIDQFPYPLWRRLRVGSSTSSYQVYGGRSANRRSSYIYGTIAPFVRLYLFEHEDVRDGRVGMGDGMTAGWPPGFDPANICQAVVEKAADEKVDIMRITREFLGDRRS